MYAECLAEEMSAERLMVDEPNEVKFAADPISERSI